VPSHPKGHLQRGHSQKKKSPRLIHGRLSVHRDGYGFVTPEEPVPGLKGDIYLGKEEADRAMHGDRVALRIKRLEGDGRAHGEIVEVVKRAHSSIVGEFRVRRRGNYVIPHDERFASGSRSRKAWRFRQVVGPSTALERALWKCIRKKIWTA
jgi:exoribonuclease R